jgi:hypothetical protein
MNLTKVYVLCEEVFSNRYHNTVGSFDINYIIFLNEEILAKSFFKELKNKLKENMNISRIFYL